MAYIVVGGLITNRDYIERQRSTTMPGPSIVLSHSNVRQETMNLMDGASYMIYVPDLSDIENQ